MKCSLNWVINCFLMLFIPTSSTQFHQVRLLFFFILKMKGYSALGLDCHFSIANETHLFLMFLSLVTLEFNELFL